MLKIWSYEVAANLALDIYDMIVYKKYLNTNVDVHIRSSNCQN